MAIGSVVVNIAANLQNFTRGLNSAAAQLQGFGSKIKSTLGAFGVGFGVQQLVSHLQRTALEMENIGDNAVLLGASVRQLSLFSGAARIAGMDTESFVTSLERMNDAIGTALGGGTDVLGKWGLSAAAMGGTDLSGQLHMVAARMAELGTAQEKLAMASDLFGRRNLDLVEILGQGTEALDAWARRAEFAGSVVTEMQTKAADTANVEMRTIKEQAGGLWRTVTGGLAEGYLTLVEGVGKNMQRGASGLLPWNFLGDIASASASRRDRRAAEAFPQALDAPRKLAPKPMAIPSLPSLQGDEAEIARLLTQIADNTEDTRRAVEDIPDYLMDED